MNINNAAAEPTPNGNTKLNEFSTDETLPATTKEPFGNNEESQGVKKQYICRCEVMRSLKNENTDTK